MAEQRTRARRESRVHSTPIWTMATWLRAGIEAQDALPDDCLAAHADAERAVLRAMAAAPALTPRDALAKVETLMARILDPDLVGDILEEEAALLRSVARDLRRMGRAA